MPFEILFYMKEYYICIKTFREKILSETLMNLKVDESLKNILATYLFFCIFERNIGINKCKQPTKLIQTNLISIF